MTDTSTKTSVWQLERDLRSTLADMRAEILPDWTLLHAWNGTSRI